MLLKGGPGVPQGTVLGPLMFILYINGIGNETRWSIRLFADDCLLYRTVSSTRGTSKLQRDPTQMCRWTDLSHINFNATKCHVLSATKKTQPLKFPYTIGGQQLQHVTHYPYLGVELADDLSWGPQDDPQRQGPPWNCSAGTLVTAPGTLKTSHIRLLCALC